MDKRAIAVMSCFLFAVLAANTVSADVPGGVNTISFKTQLIKTDPIPVESGEDAKIYFKIKNTGDLELENFKAEILDSYPFRLKPDRKRNYTLGTVKPGEEYYISTEVLVADDAPDGLNDFKVKLYRDKMDTIEKIPVMTQSRDIELSLANLRTQPTDLRPDSENNEMAVQVVNNGDKTAENVVLNIELPKNFEPISSFSSRQALGNMAPGQVKEASFLFDINSSADKGKVSVPGTVSYSASDDTSLVKKETDFDVYLSGTPLYKVESLDSEFSASDGRIKLKVTNIGSAESKSTRLRALESSDLPFSFESANQYIGTLEEGESGTAVFDLSVDKGAEEKDYLIDFETRGVKEDEVFLEEETVGLSLNGSGRESMGTTQTLVAVLVVVVISLAVVAWRKNLL